MVEIWAIIVMSIYIIHELNIVKIIYLKNDVSYNSRELMDFSPLGLGLPSADNGRPLGGKGNPRLVSLFPWDQARRLWNGGRLQAWSGRKIPAKLVIQIRLRGVPDAQLDKGLRPLARP
jgi:hypothetical protein